MKPLSDRELEELFTESFDECVPTVHIGQLQYNASHVLKCTDPVAYREEFNNWLDAELSKARLFELDGEYYDEEPNADDDNEECV